MHPSVWRLRKTLRFELATLTDPSNSLHTRSTTSKESASTMKLIIRAGSHICAVNLADVVETMRPVPVEYLAGAPEGVLGISVIRGASVPVVNLASLLGERDESVAIRFVTIRTGERQVALSVDEVLGIRDIPPTLQKEMPPLLREARPDIVEAVGTLDAELLLILKAGSLLREEVWNLVRIAQEH